MEKPPGYVSQGETSQVCLLCRAIYELKQCPHAWFVKLSGLLMPHGFNPCKSDPTVMRKTTFVGYVVLEIYVDNILLTSSNEASIFATKAYLQMHFTIHGLKTPQYFLGIEFAYQLGKLALSQRKYALDLLQETGILGCKPTTSPLEVRPKFWDIDSPMMADANRYWPLLGKLIYLTISFLDITNVFSVLSQFMQEPRMVHWEGALRVLAYYKRAPGKGLIYRRHDHLCIEPYSDVGYAGDKGDKKIYYMVLHICRR